MLDTEIKVKECDGAMQGFNYKHESFGMIRIAQTQSGGGIKTFGSEAESTGLIEFEITNCDVTQDLGQNWYHASKTIAHIVMSSIQYAELISNPNSQGSPCTIKYTSELGHIKQKHIDTKTEYVENKIQKTITQLHKDVAEMRIKLDLILDQKGTLKKSDKQKIKNIFHKVESNINGKLPYYEKCFGENISLMKAEARADINAHIQHTINQTGLAVLRDPELVNLIVKKNISNNKMVENKHNEKI